MEPRLDHPETPEHTWSPGEPSSWPTRFFLDVDGCFYSNPKEDRKVKHFCELKCQCSYLCNTLGQFRALFRTNFEAVWHTETHGLNSEDVHDDVGQKVFFNHHSSVSDSQLVPWSTWHINDHLNMTHNLSIWSSTCHISRCYHLQSNWWVMSPETVSIAQRRVRVDQCEPCSGPISPFPWWTFFCSKRSKYIQIGI